MGLGKVQKIAFLPIFTISKLIGGSFKLTSKACDSPLHRSRLEPMAEVTGSVLLIFKIKIILYCN